MIVYENRLHEFVSDVTYNRISDILLEKLRNSHLSGGSPGEKSAWQNSLHFMKDVLSCSEIPDDCEVAIEYNIPQTSKRVDFMILGADREKQDHIVIVELKQWSKVQKVDDWSRHSVMTDLRSHQPTAHPSYQAFSYKSLILNYCELKGMSERSLNPCAYLHNMDEGYRPVLEDKMYEDWTREAPIFLSHDVLKLRSFIQRYISTRSENGDMLYRIDFGRLKPTKSLQDSLDAMLCGNEVFRMIDEQVVAYDYIMNAVRKAQEDGKKHVLIIRGGPGTGKSVLAINVLADCIRKLGLNASYITKNSAPRNCYTELLSGGNARKEINLKQAITSPHVLPKIVENGLDVGIFDEAHRMVKKPFMYPGQDMLQDAITAARTSIFFVDDDQRITTKDIYSADTIREYAEEAGAVMETAEPYELTSQFRCNGSNGYIAFLDSVLGFRETANICLDRENFDFRVFDTPQQMKEALVKVDAGKNRSRMCAGYCYDWNVKNGRGNWDIEIGDFKAKWNLSTDSIFAVNPESINEIGCIHTVQGMEFDYVGVIIGKDLVFRDGSVCTDQKAISKDDKTSGIRNCKDRKLADRLIRNTYKVLLTRGLKGCFVFCEDSAFRDYLRSFLSDHDDGQNSGGLKENVVMLPAVHADAVGNGDFHEEEIIQRIPVSRDQLPADGTENCFFLQVSDDSMKDVHIGPDSFVLILRMNGMQGDLKDGDIVVCQMADGGTVLRTYFRRPDGICLHPENPACEDLLVPYEAFLFGKARIFGKMIRVWN